MNITGLLAAIALVLAVASFVFAGPLLAVAVILLSIALLLGNFDIRVR